MRYALYTKTEDRTKFIKFVDGLNARQIYTENENSSNEKTLVIPCTTDKDGNANGYGVFRCGIQVATKSIKNVCTQAPTDTQYKIRNELTALNAKVGMSTEAERLGASYILSLIDGLTADTQDYIDIAVHSIFKDIAEKKPLDVQYRNAFLALNAENYKLKTNRQKELSTEYIQENGGQLIQISTQIARVINSDEKYTPSFTWNTDENTQREIARAISEFAKTLTDRQKQVLILTVKGYSQRGIMEKLKIKTISTINDHLTKIRAAFVAYAEKNAPIVLEYVKADKVKTTDNTRGEDKHTNNAERAKKVAEYGRKYRERKKAEKQNADK